MFTVLPVPCIPFLTLAEKKRNVKKVRRKEIREMQHCTVCVVLCERERESFKGGVWVSVQRPLGT